MYCKLWIQNEFFDREKQTLRSLDVFSLYILKMVSKHDHQSNDLKIFTKLENLEDISNLTSVIRSNVQEQEEQEQEEQQFFKSYQDHETC